MAKIDYMQTWEDLRGPIEEKYDIQPGTVDREDLRSATRETFQAFLIEVYREELRQQYAGLPALGDLDPLILRAIELHHWQPAVTKAMSEEELVLALADELSHFKLPEETQNWVIARLHPLPALEQAQLTKMHYSE